MTVNLSKLPDPDSYGNYWLASSNRDRVGQPAIFPVKGEKRYEGMYYISLGDEVLFGKDNRFVVFPTPMAALRELRKLLNG